MADGMFYTLGLRTGSFTGPLGSATSALGSFAGKVATLMTKGVAIVGPIAAAAGAVGGLGKAIKDAADMESTTVAFNTLIGDMKQATSTLDALKRMGAETPFEFPELADAGRKLIAFGEAAKSVPETLRRIGDVSSGIQQPIGEIAEIYGKARVQGQLFAEDINQLTGRGIPIISQFAKILRVSESEVKNLASEGKITFPLLEQAFINLTAKGGQFHDMMAQQSTTTNGLLSTLKDSLGEIFRVIGTPINDALRPILKDSIEFTNRLGQGMSAFIKLLTAAKSQGKLGEFLALSLSVGVKEGINTLSSGVRGVVAYMGAALPRVFSEAKQSLLLDDILLALKNAFKAAGEGLASAVIAAVSKIPGLGDLAEESASMAQSAENHWRVVANLIEDATSPDRITAGADALAKSLRDIHAAGTAAADAEQSKDPLFKTADGWKKLAELGAALDPEAWKDLFTAIHPQQKEPEKKEDTPQKTKADNIDSAIKDAKAAKAAKAAKEVPVKDVPGKAETDHASRGEEEPEGRRRIRLFNLRDSAMRRFQRMSDADLGKRGFSAAAIAGIHQQGQRTMNTATRRRDIANPAAATNNAISQTNVLLASIDRRLSMLEAV